MGLRPWVDPASSVGVDRGVFNHHARDGEGSDAVIPNLLGVERLPLSRRLRRATTVIVCLATPMLSLDIAVVNTALPLMARDLHSGLSGVQWVIDAYTLAVAAVVLSAGSIAVRVGRRRVFAVGTVLFTASSLACAGAAAG